MESDLFPLGAGGRVAVATAGLLLGSFGCTPSSSPINYVGLNFAGDRLEWVVDAETGAWTVLNRDQDLTFEGDFSPSDNPDLDGFYTTDTGAALAWAVERPGRGLVTTVPTGEQGLTLNWSASTAIDTVLYRPLIEGNYSCVRLREDGADTEDILFLTLRESDFSLLALDSGATHVEELPFGVSSVELGEGDIEGSWDLGGLNDQEIVLESDEGTWEGVLFPGTMLVLRSPFGDGLLACMWSPLPNTQLSVFDGDFQFIESRRDTADYGAASPSTVDIFGDVGELYRLDEGDGGAATSLGDRAQVYYVGNLIFWQSAEDTWLYQAVAADFYMQWTQQGGGGGPDGPPRPMTSFGVGFHPRDLPGTAGATED